MICSESGFDEAASVYFSARGKLREGPEEEEKERPEDRALALDASIIEIVDQVIGDATSMKASDIHIEPREDVLHVRCRVDGVLHDLREYPPELQPGVVSRIKIMGNMNIAERRLPQDGRTTFETSSGETVDLRLASIPSLYGENITIRILEASPLPPTLASLGLSKESLQRYETALAIPEGGIIICGPTGCGKSTTLYTTLELIKSPERKVYTVEDPVERKIRGIVQSEVRPAIGLTFARAMRALVRADPDVIMVGEVRDLETAKMAADAAITGHLVFTHPAHLRRRLHRPPPGRDGRAALPGGGGLPLRRGAAARPPPLYALPHVRDDQRRALGAARLGRRHRTTASPSTTRSAARSASAPATAAA